LEPLSVAAFAATLAAVNAAPGPVTAIILARVMGRDTRGAAAFASGVACADIAALVLVWTGLALSAQSYPQALAVLRWLGAGYLLWLALGMWRSAAGPDLGAQPGPGNLVPGILAGTATCLCNPHTLLFFLALLPGLVPLDRLDRAHDLAGGLGHGERRDVRRAHLSRRADAGADPESRLGTAAAPDAGAGDRRRGAVARDGLSGTIPRPSPRRSPFRCRPRRAGCWWSPAC
jgi:threonine/homoserine/homoserine lactone efflux protein